MGRMVGQLPCKQGGSLARREVHQPFESRFKRPRGPQWGWWFRLSPRGKALALQVPVALKEESVVALSQSKSELTHPLLKAHSLTTWSKMVFQYPNYSPPHQLVFCMAFLTANRDFISLLPFCLSLLLLRGPLWTGNWSVLFIFVSLAPSLRPTCSTQ